MTASELRSRVEARGSKFFSRENMKFAGDTMTNFGVCSATVKTCLRPSVECWQLYRKRATRKGMTGSSFFCKETFEQVHGEPV